MNYQFGLLLGVALLLGCSGNQNQEATATTPYFDAAEAVAEVKELTEKLWSDGYANKDTALVASVYHPDFMLIDDEGSGFKLEDELSFVVNYGDQYQNFDYTVQSVTTSENGTAVVIAKCRFQGTDSGGQVFATNYLQTLTFVQTAGSWKVLLSQVSGVSEEVIPGAPKQ